MFFLTLFYVILEQKHDDLFWHLLDSFEHLLHAAVTIINGPIEPYHYFGLPRIQQCVHFGFNGLTFLFHSGLYGIDELVKVTGSRLHLLSHQVPGNFLGKSLDDFLGLDFCKTTRLTIGECVSDFIRVQRRQFKGPMPPHGSFE